MRLQEPTLWIGSLQLHMKMSLAPRYVDSRAAAVLCLPLYGSQISIHHSLVLGPPLTGFRCQGLASPWWPTQKNYKPLPCSRKVVREHFVNVKLRTHGNTFSSNDVVTLLARVLVITHEAQEEIFMFFWKNEAIKSTLIPRNRPQAGYV